MAIEPIVFFDLIITIFILTLIIVILTVYFLRSIKKLRYQIQSEILRGISKKNSYLSDEARNKVIKIIDEANNKALDIIQRANLFANISNDSLNKELKAVTEREIKAFEKTTSDFTKAYETVLNDLRSSNIEIFQKISNNIETSTLEEIKKFKSVIEQETISSQNLLKKKIYYEYSLAKKDIDNYRQNELKMVDERIYEILEKVSKLVLGKAIEPSQHESLIIDSLEKAKKEEIFGDEK